MTMLQVKEDAEGSHNSVSHAFINKMAVPLGTFFLDRDFFGDVLIDY